MQPQVIELPLMNPDLFVRVGIKPPKGVLLYGPPGTGKTLLARAIASNVDANFLKVVSSAIVDKYIGESARVIREMFGKAAHSLFLLGEEKIINIFYYQKVMPATMSPALFSWMKSTRSVEGVSRRVPQLIVKSRER